MVFFLISLGGQAPHVLGARMGHACGEPNEIELTPVGVKLKLKFELTPIGAELNGSQVHALALVCRQL